MQVFQTLKNYILQEDVSYEKKNGVTIGSCGAGHLSGGAALASDSSEVIILSDEAGIVSEEMEADSEETELSAGKTDTESAVEEAAGKTEGAASQDEAESSQEAAGIALIEAIEEVSEDEIAVVSEGADEAAAIAADAGEPAEIWEDDDDDEYEDTTTVITPQSGTCGDNVTWTLSSDGTLTISGTGAMYDDSPISARWDAKKVVVEDGVTRIGSKAFFAGFITEIILPDSVTSIGEYAFWHCENLSSVVMPKGVTKIEEGTFGYCPRLSEIVIPDGVVSIGEKAFITCESLKSVKIPDSVVSIGDYAFHDALSTGVTIPSSVTSIGEYAFGYGLSVKWEDYVISGYTGSAAEAYAKKYEFTFVSLGSVDTTTNTDTTVTLATGTISKLTNSSSGIKIQWNQVSGATGYYIYRKTGSGSYSKIKTITSGSTVSYTDTAVKKKNGTTYTYKVVPYSGSTTGTGTAKKTVRLTGTTLSSVKNSASKKATVKWKKTTKVSGYQIQYSTSKTFASGNKTTTVSGASKTSKKLTGLKKGKTYYVRVRTYKTVSGKKYYSAWSSVKKVKISK